MYLQQWRHPAAAKTTIKFKHSNRAFSIPQNSPLVIVYDYIHWRVLVSRIVMPLTAIKSQLCT